MSDRTYDAVFVDVTVEQVPVAVKFECPACGAETRIEYETMTCDHGQPPDWRTVKCGSCGAILNVNAVEYD